MIAGPSPWSRPSQLYEVAGRREPFPTHAGTEGQALLYQCQRVWDGPEWRGIDPARYPALTTNLPVPDRMDARALACFAMLSLPIALHGKSKVVFVKSGVAEMVRDIKPHLGRLAHVDPLLREYVLKRLP